MKTLNKQLNIFPIVEKVEVMNIVLIKGTMDYHYDLKGRLILTSNKDVISLIDMHYNNGVESEETEGHISYFKEYQMIFPKGYYAEIIPADNLPNEHKYKMECFRVYRERRVSYSYREVEAPEDLPWFPEFICMRYDGKGGEDVVVNGDGKPFEKRQRVTEF